MKAESRLLELQKIDTDGEHWVVFHVDKLSEKDAEKLKEIVDNIRITVYKVA